MSGGKGKDMEKTFWYKDAVIYQIWPRSFKDADGDGVGDLMGVYEKLDYLKSLHVDAIWFSPLYPSPNADFGYDVADYMDISAEYGGMAAFKKVLDGAHERGIRVIMDLVVNHTSDGTRGSRRAAAGKSRIRIITSGASRKRTARSPTTGTACSRARRGSTMRCARHTISTFSPSSSPT